MISKTFQRYIITPLLKVSKILSNERIFQNKLYCSSSTKTIFSGIQPTGSLHLGNYFGAINNWVLLQNSGNKTIYSVMDLHAMTLNSNYVGWKKNNLECIATLIACGIDPDKSILFKQSSIPQHLQLYWILLCKSNMAHLDALPQFKEKSAKFDEDGIPTGLYVYPILQAADVLLYKATHVPVGKDQVAHINVMREIAKRANKLYGKILTIPKILIHEEAYSSIKSFADSSKKMSKSDNKSCVFLCDSSRDIKSKVESCLTDTNPIYYDAENRPAISNLMTIHAAVTEKSYNKIEKDVANLNTEAYKKLVAEALIEFLIPIQLKLKYLLANKEYLEDILTKGTEKATKIATVTYDQVKIKAGFSR